MKKIMNNPEYPLQEAFIHKQSVCSQRSFFVILTTTWSPAHSHQHLQIFIKTWIIWVTTFYFPLRLIRSFLFELSWIDESDRTTSRWGWLVRVTLWGFYETSVSNNYPAWRDKCFETIWHILHNAWLFIFPSSDYCIINEFFSTKHYCWKSCSLNPTYIWMSA